MASKEGASVSITTLPLKAYDFFSVIIPGACLLLSAYCFEEVVASNQQIQLGPNTSPALFVHWVFNETWHETPSPIAQSVLLGLSLFVVYLTGHIVSSIANFYLDRIFFYKCYGYPYEFLLLGDPRGQKPNVRLSRCFYKGSIFWLHWMAISFGIYALFRYKWAIVTTIVLFSVWLFVLLSRFALSIFNRILLSMGLTSWNPFLENIRQWMLKAFGLPFDLFTNPIQKINRTNDAFSKEFIEKYNAFFKADFERDPVSSGSDNYWFCLFYVTKRDPVLGDVILRWRQTSIFARNIAASFYLAFLYSVAVLWVNVSNENGPYKLHLALLLYLFLNLAIFMTVRFHYFFIAYYTKCMFRAYCFLHSQKN